MKKILALTLAIAMLLTLAACTTNETKGPSVADAKELLTKVWDVHAEDERFAAAGGDFSETNMTMDAPGKFGIADVETIQSMLLIPADSVALIDDAASLMHMMNANTFTCGAFHVADSANVTVLADTMKDVISQNQWMCGFPDKFTVITVGNYVISVFGNEQLVDTFKTHTTEVYESANVVYDEPIA